MFENEEVKAGVSIHVYRLYQTSDKDIMGKNTLSMTVRMSGEKALKGQAVLQPIILREAEASQKALEEAESVAAPKKPLFGRKAWVEKMMERKLALDKLRHKRANVLWGFSMPMGEALLEDIKKGMQEQGLTMSEPTIQSNAELMEEVYHWA